MKKGLTQEETITFGNIIADIYAEEYGLPVELSDFEAMFYRVFDELVASPAEHEAERYFPGVNAFYNQLEAVERFVDFKITWELSTDRRSGQWVDCLGLFVGSCLRDDRVQHEKGLRWAIRKMDEPNWDLKKAWYRLYLDTDEWRDKRNEALRRDGFKCVRCSSIRSLQVHHLTYERIGVEAQEDLVTLCRPCHEAIEDVPSNLACVRREVIR